MGVEELKLYIRLPVKIKEEIEIKDLHPAIEVVHLPRQKSRRWCTVDFKSKEDCSEALKHIRKLRIDGKKIKVFPVKKTHDRKTKN